MMRKKYAACGLALLLCGGLVLSGCGRNTEEEPVDVVAEIVEVEPVEEAETEELQSVGDESASIMIPMTNELGGSIVGLAVKSPEMTDYPSNMMESGQIIEDGETVNFYYDVQGAELADIDPVQPTTSYIGFWNPAGDDDVELTITDVTDDSVTFSLWWNRIAQTDDITVQLDSDLIGTFSGKINDASIEGRIVFGSGSVGVTLDVCPIAYIEEGTTIFDEMHETYWAEYGNGSGDTYAEEEYSEGEESEDGTNLYVPETQTTTHSLKVTMENGTVYELSYFDVEDMSEVTLCYEDGIAYLEYVKTSTNERVNTKALEQQLKVDKEAAQVVIDMIAALGEVTLETEPAITAAQEAYEALTDQQKSYVTNVDVLEQKLAELAALMPAEEEVEEEIIYDTTDSIDAEVYDDYDEGNYNTYGGEENNTVGNEQGGDNTYYPQNEEEWDDYDADDSGNAPTTPEE